MDDRKNLITALILSVIIITSWNFFIEKPKYDEYLTQKQIYDDQLETRITEEKANHETISSQKEIIKNSPRIDFENNDITGSINQNSGYLDELTLRKYKISKDSDENVQLLRKKLESESYFIDLIYGLPLFIQQKGTITIWILPVPGSFFWTGKGFQVA